MLKQQTGIPADRARVLNCIADRPLHFSQLGTSQKHDPLNLWRRGPGVKTATCTCVLLILLCKSV